MSLKIDEIYTAQDNSFRVEQRYESEANKTTIVFRSLHSNYSDTWQPEFLARVFNISPDEIKAIEKKLSDLKSKIETKPAVNKSMWK